LIGPFFRFAIPDPGDDSTVDRSVPGDTSWDAVQGPSFRGVYDLADLDASRFMIAPGQSGNPFSSQATNLLRGWRDGATFPLPTTPPDGAAHLTLLPASH
jgi:penicillin amidase